jgi:hypothetical protein
MVCPFVPFLLAIMLSVFDLWILMIPLVSSNSSCWSWFCNRISALQSVRILHSNFYMKRNLFKGRLFQTRVMRSKFDIYVCIAITCTVCKLTLTRIYKMLIYVVGHWILEWISNCSVARHHRIIWIFSRVLK